jgi:hypothetical protein
MRGFRGQVLLKHGLESSLIIIFKVRTWLRLKSRSNLGNQMDPPHEGMKSKRLIHFQENKILELGTSSLAIDVSGRVIRGKLKSEKN